MGNMDSQRDWGYAPDYVRAMHAMLQQPEPEDFVIGTGETHSPREFAELAFKYAGLDYKNHVVETDPEFMRPAEVDHLLADASKARKKLGWKPSVTFDELVRLMVEADLRVEAMAS
jgi:GDPmannose 4,6-dehydratase